MKNLTTSLLAVSLFVATGAQAAQPVKSSGHAVSLCKAQASASNENYKRARASKIKQTRGVYKIKLKVLTEDGSSNALCEIAKDGTITYSKA